MVAANLALANGCASKSDPTDGAGSTESGSDGESDTMGSTSVGDGDGDSGTSAGDGDGDTSDSQGDGDGDGDGDVSCGNGIVENSEICDGTDLDGVDCQSLGYEGGTLACQSDCSAFDVSGCAGSSCGDDVIDANEFCDGSALDGESCEGLGFSGGDLGCTADCLDYDLSMCEETCDQGEAEMCEGYFIISEGECVDWCPWAGCAHETCMSDCLVENQTTLTSCYAEAGCIFDSLRAECELDCAIELDTCNNQTDCADTCASDHDVCVSACQ